MSEAQVTKVDSIIIVKRGDGETTNIEIEDGLKSTKYTANCIF